MSVTSFHFFFMFACSLLIYYTVLQKFQWQALLLFSVYFFGMSSGWKMGIIFLANAAVTGYLAVHMSRFKEAGNEKAAKCMLVSGVFFNAAVLAVLKYSHFFIYNWNILLRFFHKEPLLETLQLDAPIGISFYTLISIGYLADVYWGLAEAEKNPFKMALLLGYYPQ